MSAYDKDEATNGELNRSNKTGGKRKSTEATNKPSKKKGRGGKREKDHTTEWIEGIRRDRERRRQ